MAKEVRRVFSYELLFTFVCDQFWGLRSATMPGSVTATGASLVFFA